MLEKKTFTSFEYLESSNSFTIHLETIVTENGKEIGQGRHSRGFSCDMLEELIEYVGDNHPVVLFAKEFWTSEVVAAFKERVALEEARLAQGV